MKPGNSRREGGKKGGMGGREGRIKGGTGGRDQWEGGRDVMAIMKWVHMAWNGCIIGRVTNREPKRIEREPRTVIHVIVKRSKRFDPMD